MKKLVFHLFFSLYFIGCLVACTGSKKASGYVPPSGETVTTSSGLQYNIYQQGTGEPAEMGDIVEVHYVGKLENDSVFDSSRKRGEPLRFKLGTGQVIKGWEEGISYMKVGDKAKLTIPPELAYGNRKMSGIPANSTLVFDVELVDVIKPSKPFDVEGKDTTNFNSGLRIIKVKEVPSAAKAQKGQNVTVHYTGYLPDGRIFDSSVDRGKPITFPLGSGRVIKAWDEGIAELRVGEKARLIVPPHLGYGDAGYPPVIPANATLIFDVELISTSN